MGSAMSAAQGYAVARYAAAVDHHTLSLTDAEFTAWLDSAGGDWERPLPGSRVLTGHGDRVATHATRAWADLNRFPDIDPSGESWDDPAVSLALRPLLNGPS
ncbi:hypothetical protein CFP75_05240 [Amycolatopsis alba DSM 44262]|uniref:Uncharacterized protein n=1 Tax=Amycolatopsis alba DSM 44262 TaxID=1125972 RepID=A0A229S7A7_AMYAL|nr:hypothetical protein CFP75_05240 [Amycolatopsis alba DSM 44262]